MVDLPEIDEAACLKVIVDLVKIDSRTLTPNEGACTDHIARVMEELGIPSEVVPFGDEGRQNAVGTWGKGEGGGKTLLFNGHLDTNPIGEGWTVDPWGGVVRDDCVFGIGVSNMKSGCAAYLCAVMTLHQAGFRPKGKVLLTYVVGELQGGPGTQALIEKGYCDADFFINCEPSDVRAITMHAESLIFEIDLVGDTRHMSNREAATDAILAATDLVPRLTKLKYEGAISEDHLRCNRTHVGVLHSALGKDLNETRPPQVADFARIKGAARYGPGQTPRMVLRGLDKVCQETVAVFPQLQYTVRHIPSQTMPAFEVPKDAPIVKALNRAYESVRGEPQPTGALTPVCFYGSDAGHLYRSLGMQGVVCGPGGKYNTMPDERVELKDYFDCIRVFIEVIADVVGVERVRT